MDNRRVTIFGYGAVGRAVEHAMTADGWHVRVAQRSAADTASEYVQRQGVGSGLADRDEHGTDGM